MYHVGTELVIKMRIGSRDMTSEDRIEVLNAMMVVLKTNVGLQLHEATLWREKLLHFQDVATQKEGRQFVLLFTKPRKFIRDSENYPES